MIVLKYTKTYPSCMAGHMDTMRTVMRLLRRAGAKVNYSQGFNPHMQVAGGVALAVGVDSCCEYVSVEMPYEDGLIDRLNDVSPNGITFTECHEVERINLVAPVLSADYIVTMTNIANYVESITDEDLIITYSTNKGVVSKAVGALVNSARGIDNDNIMLNLACGNSNLRPDRLIDQIVTNNNILGDYSIKKTQVYVAEGTFDEYIEQLKANNSAINN